MKKNNIKHDALAAFRFYAQNKSAPICEMDADDAIVIAAVTATLNHLRIDKNEKTLDVIRCVCFDLPPDDLARGEITTRVEKTAAERHISTSCVWRELRRAYRIYDAWHNTFANNTLTKHLGGR